MRLTEGKGPVYTVIVGRFITNIGFFMVIPFLTVYVTVHEGMSSLEAGLLFAILQFTRRGLSFIAGWVSDRFGAAPVLSLGLLIEAVAYGWFIVADRSFFSWAMAVALLGLGGALNNNGSRSLLAAGRSAGSAGAAVNLSRYYVSINASAMIGPLIGSALLATGRSQLGFLVTAILHLLFAVGSYILLRGLPVPKVVVSRLSDLASGLHDHHLVAYCAMAIGGWFLISQYRTALPLTIVHQGLSGELIGPLTALNALVVIIAITLIGNRVGKYGAVGRMDVLAISAVVLGGGWVLCAFGGVAPLAAAIIVTSIGESLFCGVIDAIVVTLAPKGRTGLYLGYSTMAWGVGGMLAGFTGGLFGLAAKHGTLPLFWLGLAFVGLAAGAGTWLARHYFAAAIESRQQVTAAVEARTAATS
jgi:MFS transporter, DHA1 family, multidrug resistance protein